MTLSGLRIRVGYAPGSIGRITELHALYYARESGFGVYFENRVATELAEFCTAYDADRDGLWLAHRDGVIEGSIAIDGRNGSTQGAHLRWFITSDRIRGHGIGRALIGAALDFCRSRGYGEVFLLTFAGLDAARYLYENSGFRLTDERSGNQWGTRVTEQRFAVRL